jgi:DNA-binding response OmpR family regulator
MRILLVENDQNLLTQLQTELIKQNFLVDIASDCQIAWELLHSFIYDLLLIDIASETDGDAINFCRRLREVGNLILIILMTDVDQINPRIEGLNFGADDCIIKPINYSELFAHIYALGRRGLRKAHSILSWGSVKLDPISRQVICQEKILKISRKEYLILELFMNHPRQMFTRSQISDRLWTIDEELPTDATIKSHIRSIRRKLEKAGVNNFIETHYGHGYRLNPIFDPSITGFNSSLVKPELMDSITANIWHELMNANIRLHQEIETRKDIEAQLRRSELLLRNAQKAGKIGSWEYDIVTKQTYWTEELYHLHGIDPNQSPPNNPTEMLTLIHPEDQQIYQTAIVAASLKRKPFETNLRIIRSDGEIRYINARGGPVFDEFGQCIKLTGTTFDITDTILIKTEKLF